MYGELEELEGQNRWRLRFIRVFPHPLEKVWRAITEPEHLAAWFPSTIDGERKKGARLTFAFPSDIRIPPIVGRMLAYDPPRLIELDWGGDVIRMELDAVEEGTRLTLTDTFGEQGKAARDAAGWHACLAHLEAHISGTASAEVTWKTLFAGYGRRFGPKAATIGPPAGHPEAGSTG